MKSFKKIKVNFKMPPESPAERLAREHAARRKASGLPDPSHYKQMAAQKQKEIDAMKNEETLADRVKKYIRPVTKTTPKIEKTTEPAGRTTDHTEWKVTGPSGEIKRFKSKQEAHAHYDSFKEEVEELDEISAQLKTSYRQKAIADIRALRPHTQKGEYKDLAKNVMQKRQAGVNRSVKEELEQLEEMPESSMKVRDVHAHLKKSGWALARSSGGHDIYKHPQAKHHIPVPRHKQLKAPLIRGIMKASKVTEEAEIEEQLEKKGRFVSGPIKQPFKSSTIVTSVKEENDDKIIVTKKGTTMKQKISAGSYDVFKKHGFRKESKDESEYGYEGDMALNQLATLTRCAEMIKDLLKPDTDMPEWVQSKITLATDYIQTAADYMHSEMKEEVELDEAIKIGSKVTIHSPGKDYHGTTGHVGEIRKGAFKGAAKTYTVDHDGGSIQVGQKHVKLHSEEVELDETSNDPWKSKYFGPTKVIKQKYHVKTDTKSYNVRADTKEHAHELVTKHAPGSKIVSIEHKGRILEEVELDEVAVVKTNKEIGTRVVDVGPGGKEYNVKTNAAWDNAKKKLPQGADFAAQRRKERLAANGRMDEGRQSQRHPLEGHEYHKKSNEALIHIAKDAHAAAEAMKGHNTTAENKYRDQANDSATVRYYRQKHGMQDWYKKKYGHVNEANEPTTQISPQDPLMDKGKPMSRKAEIVKSAAKGKAGAKDKFYDNPELSGTVEKN